MQRRVNTGSVLGNLSVAARRLAWPPGSPGRLWPLLALALAGPPVGAQSPAASPPGAAASSPVDAATRERLQRDAERPMYWIRLHADQARAAEARKPVATPPPAPATPALNAPSRTAKAATSPLDKLPAPAAGPVTPAAAPATPLSAQVDRDPTPASAPVTTEPPTPQVMANLALPSPSAPAAAPTATAATLSATADRPGASNAAGAGTPGSAALGAGPHLELLQSSEPDFPASLVRRLRRGELQVEVEVAGNGEVSGAKVLSSSHPRLNEPALQAIRGWRFRPPAQPASAVIHFKFDIDDAG